ncbi:hypothetical protein SHKM778_73350 [Streptomyces sp. KM77-8]|uniref:CN hydrolase domain-containing protein n=1 Tax=Streptomyces haneummycinicus TaxID=3074435 RepID=A0AAT9HTL2_9ACTN
MAGRWAGAGGALSGRRAAPSVNASPYERDKDDTRLELVRKRAQEAGCTTAYLAMTGGQDELVFDGDSIVVDRDGGVVTRAPQFAEACVVVDLELPAARADAPTGVVDDGLRIDRVVLSEDTVPAYEASSPGEYASRLDDDEEVYSALVVGLRAYAEKNGFRSVLIGLSGGSTRRWSPRSRATRWARRTCTACPCRRSTPPTTPRATRRSWRGGRG